MFQVGDEIAGYRVEAVLGAGGMGEVYRVRHPRLPRSDAFKVLRSAHAADPVVRQRFEREADLMAPLTHPNLVRVYDRGVLDEVLWIAMEMVPGTDTSKMVKMSPGGLDPRLVANIVDGVAAGLDVAHRHGILHRDVKPANILLTPGEDPIMPDAVKVTDFGIAQVLDEAGAGLTGTGTTVGTMRYCSPEQIDGRNVDGRADLYSLAATAFEFLTGSSPFDATSIQGLMTAHLFTQPPAASARNRSLSPAVDAVLAAGLAKDPAHRPPNCTAFARALRTALFEGRGPAPTAQFVNTPGMPVQSYSPGVGYTSGPQSHPMPLQPQHPAAAAPWFKRLPVVATAAAVAATALGVGGAFAWAAAGSLSGPSGVTAEMTPKGVDLSWNAVDGATEYVVKEDDQVIRTVDGTSFTLTSTFPGEHTYSVAARSSSKKGSDFTSADPLKVTLTWGPLYDTVALYPELIPSTPLSTNAFEGLRCEGEGPDMASTGKGSRIRCEKTDGAKTEYQVTIGAYGSAEEARSATYELITSRYESDFDAVTARGAKGTTKTGENGNESRVVFTFGDRDDPRNRTYVMVAVPGAKNEKSAVDIFGRLPI